MCISIRIIDSVTEAQRWKGGSIRRTLTNLLYKFENVEHCEQHCLLSSHLPPSSAINLPNSTKR